MEPLPEHHDTIDGVRQIIGSSQGSINININKKYGVSGETLLHVAAYTNNLELVKYLVESGADVNACDNGNRTPLHEAGRGRGDIDMIKYLLDHGADKEKVTILGNTIYTLYAVRTRPEMIEHIKSHSYDPVPTKGVQCG